MEECRQKSTRHESRQAGRHRMEQEEQEKQHRWALLIRIYISWEEPTWTKQKKTESNKQNKQSVDPVDPP